MAGSTIGFRPDEETREKIDQYRERRGLDSQSEAMEELVKTGLLERTSPMMYRFKDQIVGYAGDFAVFAVLMLLIGRLSSVLAWRSALTLAFVLVSAATVLLATYELARVVAGSNQLGQSVRNAIARVRRV